MRAGPEDGAGESLGSQLCPYATRGARLGFLQRSGNRKGQGLDQRASAWRVSCAPSGRRWAPPLRKCPGATSPELPSAIWGVSVSLTIAPITSVVAKRMLVDLGRSGALLLFALATLFVTAPYAPCLDRWVRTTAASEMDDMPFAGNIAREATSAPDWGLAEASGEGLLLPADNMAVFLTKAGTPPASRVASLAGPLR